MDYESYLESLEPDEIALNRRDWYREKYLQSSYWKEFKKSVLADRNFCESLDCSSGFDLEIHHHHYKTLGCESFEDIAVWCHVCHAAYHGRTVLEYA